MREKVCVSHLIPLIFYRFIITGSSFKTLSFSFRVGVATVAKIVRELAKSIWQSLQAVHMPVPTMAQFIEIAKDCFSLWNFPNALGCVDGKHIKVKCPKKTGSMFWSYKHQFSMILQGLVDANYRFVIIDVGACGKQNDGSVFEASDFFRLMHTNKLEIPPPSFLPGTIVKAPYVFVADDAYPLMTNLLKPYTRVQLSLEEEIFNKRLSRLRKSVECTFGILFAKWRILSTMIETDIKVTEDLVKCMCLLLNIIIDREGIHHHLTEAVVIPVPKRRERHLGRPTNVATSVRETFKAYFANNPLVFTD